MDHATVAALMGGKRALMIFADPHSNLAISGNVGDLGKIKHRELGRLLRHTIDALFYDLRRGGGDHADDFLHRTARQYLYLEHAALGVLKKFIVLTKLKQCFEQDFLPLCGHAGRRHHGTRSSLLRKVEFESLAAPVWHYKSRLIFNSGQLSRSVATRRAIHAFWSYRR